QLVGGGALAGHLAPCGGYTRDQLALNLQRRERDGKIRNVVSADFPHPNRCAGVCLVVRTAKRRLHDFANVSGYERRFETRTNNDVRKTNPGRICIDYRTFGDKLVAADAPADEQVILAN